MERQSRSHHRLASYAVPVLCLSMLLWGCVSSEKVTTTTTTTTTTGAGTGASTGAGTSALPVVSYPNPPAPYKTIDIGGAEMREGRYPVGKSGGNLVRSIIASDPKTFNYWEASDNVSRELAGLMFGGTLNTDPYTGDVITDMAESFKADPDGLTYYTTLRKGLKWSDGKPITADDVTYTWNTIIKGGYGNSSMRDVLTVQGKFPVVSSVDQYTNKYVTPVKFAPFLRMIGIAIAPKHIVDPIIQRKDGRQAFHRLWSTSADPSTFVTSGPFVLKRFVPAQRVEFVPTKNFYEVNSDKKPLPYLQNLTYLIVGDVNTNLLKFQAKEIDNTPVRARDVVKMMDQQTSLNFKLYNTGPSTGTTFVMFNLNRRNNPKNNKPFVDPIKSAWFNDVNFRQAINHAINRDEMVQNYFKGIATPLFTAEPVSSRFFDKDLAPFKQDFNYSRDLLAKSGFKVQSDGWLHDKGGHRVEFNLTTAAGSTFYDFVGNTFVDNMKQLHIKVNFQQLDFNVLNDKTSGSLDWDCVLMSLTGGPLEPNDGANIWRSNGRLHMFDLRLQNDAGDSKVSDARPWEKRLDQLFDEGATTFDDAKRHKIYDEYQKIIYDQAPFIYIVTPMVIIANRNTVQNYEPTALTQDINGFHNLEEIWKTPGDGGTSSNAETSTGTGVESSSNTITGTNAGSSSSTITGTNSGTSASASTGTAAGSSSSAGGKTTTTTTTSTTTSTGK